jgi:hypothetical protein
MFALKRAKRVPSSSWLPAMKGTLAYFPLWMESSGERMKAVPSGRGRYESETEW